MLENIKGKMMEKELKEALEKAVTDAFKNDMEKIKEIVVDTVSKILDKAKQSELKKGDLCYVWNGGRPNNPIIRRFIKQADMVGCWFDGADNSRYIWRNYEKCPFQEDTIDVRDVFNNPDDYETNFLLEWGTIYDTNKMSVIGAYAMNQCQIRRKG